MKPKNIDFEHELTSGIQSYEKKVGKWWIGQSLNNAHKRAYNRIVDTAVAHIKKEPKVIIDYACGAGPILTRLYKRFPKSEIIGIDGSSLMLEKVEKRLQEIGGDFDKRVLLVESFLPNFTLDIPKADLLVFAFPNLVILNEDQPYLEEHGYNKRKDTVVCNVLAESREDDPDEETVTDDPETLFDSLMTAKVVSRNLRQIMKKKGICIRAEYSNADRYELTKLVEARQSFEEGSLNKKFGGKKPDCLFSLRASAYYRSKVIEDVYHQTGDESDRQGGFFINVLKAK